MSRLKQACVSSPRLPIHGVQGLHLDVKTGSTPRPRTALQPPPPPSASSVAPQPQRVAPSSHLQQRKNTSSSAQEQPLKVSAGSLYPARINLPPPPPPPPPAASSLAPQPQRVAPCSPLSQTVAPTPPTSSKDQPQHSSPSLSSQLQHNLSQSLLHSHRNHHIPSFSQTSESPWTDTHDSRPIPPLSEPLHTVSPRLPSLSDDRTCASSKTHKSDLESRFAFHSIVEFPVPELFTDCKKIYHSEQYVAS